MFAGGIKEMSQEVVITFLATWGQNTTDLTPHTNI